MAFPISDLVIEKEIALGAEARLYSGRFFGFPVVIKHRYPKTYRNSGIDNKLRKDRTIKEVRSLQSARDLGINVPFVLDVDKENWIIIMDELFASPLKFKLELNTLHHYFFNLGKMVAKLHNGGIIQGDLTTSNVFVDFGLGYHTQNIEDYAVDVLVLKHILESSHPQIYSKAFESFMEGYNNEKTNAKSVVKRMEKVELRVRYKSH
ncbi:MAG: KEOPS complex kinase/ATPase Bud32 [Candidatus Kariarchaeaceae archaeon]|jgi:Kae1-associated kinase Bud32